MGPKLSILAQNSYFLFQIRNLRKGLRFNTYFSNLMLRPFAHLDGLTYLSKKLVNVILIYLFEIKAAFFSEYLFIAEL